MCPDWLQELSLELQTLMNEPGMVTTLAWMVREPWVILTSTTLVEKILGDFNFNNARWEKILGVFYWDKNQEDLRVDLTEPEKAFDWISIRKILGSIYWTGQGLGISSTG